MNEDVAAITRRELGVAPDGATLVADGLQHETYVVTCGGREYVLQFEADRVADRRDSLARCLACYRALRDSEVPVPGAVTESVRTLGGRRYALVEKLPGTSGKLDLTPERVRNAGPYLAAVHDHRSFDAAGWLRVEDGGFSVERFRAGSLAGRLRRRLPERAETLRGAGMTEAARAVAQFADDHGDAFPADAESVLCHGDFSPDNVLYDGSEVTGVVDFDRAYAGHAHRDLAHAANAFWMHDPGADWAVRETLYDGYRTAADLDPRFERHEPRYRVETLAGLVAGMIELGELSEYEREFYGDRLQDAVERAERVE